MFHIALPSFHPNTSCFFRIRRKGLVIQAIGNINFNRKSSLVFCHTYLLFLVSKNALFCRAIVTKPFDIWGSLERQVSLGLPRSGVFRNKTTKNQRKGFSMIWCCYGKICFRKQIFRNKSLVLYNTVEAQFGGHQFSVSYLSKGNFFQKNLF